MAIPLDTSGANDVHEGGSNRADKPQLAHVQVTDMDDTLAKYESVIATLKILARAEPGQCGREHVEFFSLSEKALPRLNRFAMVLGLIEPGQKGDVDFTQAIGRDLVVKLVARTFTKRDGTSGEGVQVDFMGMWKKGHPDIERCPLADVPTVTPKARAADTLDF